MCSLLGSAFTDQGSKDVKSGWKALTLYDNIEAVVEQNQVYFKFICFSFLINSIVSPF